MKNVLIMFPVREGCGRNHLEKGVSLVLFLCEYHIEIG